MSITIKDIAIQSGFSVSTVSRAINNHPDINKATKDIILKIVEKNNFIPNNSARNLKRLDSKSIAVLVKGMSNPFFNSMLKIFEEEIHRKKFSFILHQVKENENEVDIALALEKEKKLRGIVFLGGYFSQTENKLKQIKAPFVLSTISLRDNNGKQKYASASIDDLNESLKVVDYLCSLGHKKIAIISALPNDRSIGKLRLDGYKKALKKNNIKFNKDLVFSSKEILEPYSMENGYYATNELLKSKKDFTAIFAISDTIAIGCCRAIIDSGKKIPEDYSIVGFDGMDIGKYYNPSLTTIKQPIKEIAKESIKILFNMINESETEIIKNRLFPGELIVGESTRDIN